MELRTEDFDFALPEELIAQEPAPQRDASRLLVLDRSNRTFVHRHFSDLPDYLRPGDLLVLNRSRVIPARLAGRKVSGGRVELLLLRRQDSGDWTALVSPSRRLRPGAEITFEGRSLRCRLEDECGDGIWLVRFSASGDIESELRDAGTVPLPPYIKGGTVASSRYQTVYADRDGSVAAPTAGLHFTEELLDRIRRGGVGVEYLTLHVGLGTFRPVTCDLLSEHRMHAEWGEVPVSVSRAVNRARERGGRVIAVGTTTVRLLESAVVDGKTGPFQGDTDCFIYPGYRFGAVDALVTNFHLPRSTLLMLVSAFAGRELVLDAYRDAIAKRYRFYSFGDAMLIV